MSIRRLEYNMVTCYSMEARRDLYVLTGHLRYLILPYHTTNSYAIEYATEQL